MSPSPSLLIYFADVLLDNIHDVNFDNFGSRLINSAVPELIYTGLR
jgi:hypothetical protein